MPSTDETRRIGYAMPPEAVAEALGTGDDGLSQSEAARRLERHGPNQLEEAPAKSNLAIFLHQFRSPLIYILFVAAAATVLLGEYIDAAVIGAVVALNALIGFVQERGAERSVRALMQLVSPKARVIRDGAVKEMESRDLVPGDLVLLESGDRVPADLRLVSVAALQVDESLLTGESRPVRKSAEAVPEDSELAERRSIAHAGSIIATGRARGVVIATGSKTELGKIAEEIREEPETVTPLQQRMSRFAKIIGVAVAISAVAAFGVGVALGESIGHMFMVAVALAVAAVPEGLPVVFTITLAIGVRRMARRHAIVRRLTAVETLGSTSVIGSDKTGTLTRNEMKVVRIWAGGRRVDVEKGELSGLDPASDPALRHALLAGLLTNEATLQDRNGEETRQGDPTEMALLLSAREAGMAPESIRNEHPMEIEVPFESDRGFSSAIRRTGGGRKLWVKGGPERVVEMCEGMERDGEVVPLDREEVLDEARRMAERGLRVLAMAHKPLDASRSDSELAEHPEGLVFAGLQGMWDPPRPGVKEAIDGCRKAGIRVLMITGDHPMTARAIAVELGLADRDDPVLTGRDLAGLDDAALDRALGQTRVFARTSPTDKLRLVHACQARGDVVAVTGDGVNDAPALKAADVGVAMGKSGTDVAREASDIVLTDDDFVSIYAAVEQGRITFDNVRKVTFFLVSTGIAIVLTIFAAMVLRWPIPFLPAQILWLNLVTKGLQDVALAFEPGEPGLRAVPPRRREEGIISPVLWERSAVVAVVMAAGTLFLFLRELEATGSLMQAQTVALSVMVLFQAFHVGNSRSEFQSVFEKSFFSNRFLLFATWGAFALHVAALYLPPTQFVLRVEPIRPETWLWIVGVAVTIIPAVEIHKWLRRGARPRPVQRAAVPRRQPA